MNLKKCSDNFSGTFFFLDLAKTSMQFRESCFCPDNGSIPSWPKVITVDADRRKEPKR